MNQKKKTFTTDIKSEAVNWSSHRTEADIRWYHNLYQHQPLQIPHSTNGKTKNVLTVGMHNNGQSLSECSASFCYLCIH